MILHKRNLLFILFLIHVSTFAQNFKSEIDLHRSAYKADFVKDTHSPLREGDLQFLNFFEADSTYKVSAEISLLKNQKQFNMPTYDGTSKAFIRYAAVNFKLNGQTLKMILYRNIALMTNPLYKDLLFLPFTDLTNHKTTYGGGRYIDLNINDIEKGKINIDFNKAYNPYCAYSNGYRCPVPPEENDLAIEISAGEKNYTGAKKKQK